jgi:hypothetical protein
MTNAELKELVASLAIAHQQTEQMVQQTERIVREVTQQQKETDLRLKELAKQQQELVVRTDQRFKELAEQQQEVAVRTDQRFKELAEQVGKYQKQTDKQLRELAQQIGGLGNKFGSFTEGMAFPAMEKLLRSHWHMKVISPSVKSKQNGKTLELDILAYSDQAVHIVEVKSHLREDGLQQMLEILTTFPQAFPEHAHKAIYGVLAAVHLPEQLAKRVLQEGIYLALIHDEQFKLQVPKTFQAKSFQPSNCHH